MEEEKEKLIVQGYRQFGGKHCRTTALKNALEYHGIGTKYGKGIEPLIERHKSVSLKPNTPAPFWKRRGT